MKFKLTQTNCNYFKDEEKEKEKLEKIGFKYKNGSCINCDYNSIEINSLEELINFIKVYGTIIIYDIKGKEFDFCIEIYNYYRE